jgi:hypothetical protein
MHVSDVLRGPLEPRVIDAGAKLCDVCRVAGLEVGDRGVVKQELSCLSLVGVYCS